MYHPSYLTQKTILKIQTAQSSVTLPLPEHLRIARQAAATLPTERGQALVAEYTEQIRILNNITHEAQDDFDADTDLLLGAVLG